MNNNKSESKPKTWQLLQDIKNMELEIDAHKQIERVLKSREDRFKTIFNHAPIAYFIIDLNGNFVDGNITSFELTGYKQEDLFGKTFVEVNLIEKKDQKAISKILIRSAKGELTGPDEFTMLKKDGSRLTVEISTSPITINNEKLILCIAHNITARKKAQAKLQESEERFRKLFDSAHDALMTLHPPHWNFTSGNPAISKMFNVKNVEEFLTYAPWDISPDKQPDGRSSSEKAKEMIEIAMNRGSHYFEWIHKRINGEAFPATVLLTKIQLKDETFLQATVRDITKHKKSENILKKSESLLKSILDSTGDGLLVVDAKGRITHRNNEFIKMWKIPSRLINDTDDSKLINFVLSQLSKPSQFVDRVKKLYNSTKTSNDILHFKDGRIFERNSQPLTGDNTIAGRVWSFRDITERKQVELELRQSGEKFKRLFDSLGDAVYVTKLGGKNNGQILEVNRAAVSQIGYNKDELLKMNIVKDIYISGSGDSKGKDWKEKLRAGEIVKTTEKKRRKDGAEFWTEVIISSIEFKGKIECLSINHDVTERKQTESALTQSEAEYKSIFQTTGTATLIIGKDYTILLANDGFVNLSGFPREQLEGKKLWTEFIVEEDIERMKAQHELQRQDEEQSLQNYEFRFKDKSGKIKDIYLSVNMISGTQYSIASLLDITERKQTERALKENEEKYRTLTENLPIGIYRNTPGGKGKFIEVNNALVDMFGFKDREAMLKVNVSSLYVSSGTRKKFSDKLNSEGFVRNEELRLLRTDGSKFIGSSSARAIKDENGKITHYDGYIENVTERKELMEGIVQERDRSQLYLDIAGVMFIALDCAGNIILANQKTCEIIGKPEKELIGKNWFDNYLPKDVRSNVKDVFKNLIDGSIEVTEFHENEILTVSGEKRLIAWHNSQIKDDAGKTVGIVSSGLDITESKEDEELRKQLYEASRNLAESLDINVVLNRLSKQARSLLKCNGVTIYMLEDDQKTLKPVVCYDPPYTKQVLAVKIDIDKSFTGQAIKEKTGKIFNYHNNIKGAFHIKGTPKTDTDNLIVSPLIIDGEVIGALTLVRAKIPFTDRDLNIVNTFAVYGSTAIKNANIHKQILHEIEERKQAQALLKESHHRYESIFNGAVDGIVYSDWKGKILSVNSAFTKLIGMKKADLIEKKLILCAEGNLFGESLRKTLKFIKRALKGDAIKDYLIKIKGAELEFSTPNEKGLAGLTIMIRDVTERNKARKNIELHQKNLATLSNELTMAEEKAKRHLAITLHDKLGQSLILANFKNNELNKKVKKPEHKKIISEISDFLEDAINESRNITYELSPPVLYEMGLVPAINWKLDEIEKNNNIKTSLINRSKSYEIDKRGQIILYRSISELLQNVIKHSKADKVNVSFRLLTNDYRITVSDNGVGFDFKSIRKKVLAQKKFGLFSIMERIKYIGGRVEIDAKHRRGTKIIINMPIKNYKN